MHTMTEPKDRRRKTPGERVVRVSITLPPRLYSAGADLLKRCAYAGWTGYASGVFPRACPPEVARELWAALAQPPRKASLYEYLTWWAVPEMRQQR